jgi:hypothetical protein
LIFPIKFEGHKRLSVNEYYVIKSGYDENRLTKQNHSTALLNTEKQGKQLNKTTTYEFTFLHNLSNHPQGIYLGRMFRGWTKIMERAVKDTYFFINMELGHH